MGITLVQLPRKQLSVLELRQLVSEVAYGCAHVQSPWQQLSVLELQLLGSELGGIGLCSCAASVITLVTVTAAKSESWNKYMVNDHRPAFMKPLTAFWTNAGFLYATLRISVICHVVCLHVLSSTFSMHHRNISQTVRKTPHPKAGIDESCVVEVRP